MPVKKISEEVMVIEPELPAGLVQIFAIAVIAVSLWIDAYVWFVALRANEFAPFVVIPVLLIGIFVASILKSQRMFFDKSKKELTVESFSALGKKNEQIRFKNIARITFIRLLAGGPPGSGQVVGYADIELADGRTIHSKDMLPSEIKRVKELASYMGIEFKEIVKGYFGNELNKDAREFLGMNENK